MKKIVTVLFSLVCVICIAFSFAGCGKIEVRGNFCLLKVAYENGWLDSDDLKSIACCYYDSHNYEDNPYSGLYEEPAEELSKHLEKEIKQAYLEQIIKLTHRSLKGVEIRRYYGTYNGNIVVSVSDYYVDFNVAIEEEFYIGEVLFKDFCQGHILVYHID